jgi:transcriptional regulator with XRE-family HTH domain
MATRITGVEVAYRRELGDRLRRARVRLDWTRFRVANETGISVNSIMLYEAGEITPTSFSLDRLARALNVSPGWLLSGSASERRKRMDGPEKTGRER